MVILMDDEQRENEGDLSMAAEKATAELINFMAKYARGLICLPMSTDRIDRLGLNMMVGDNQAPLGTAFTTSISAKRCHGSGISAQDRAITILEAVREDATAAGFITPGYVYPLRARDGGVLVRTGQTEGAVDLARLAGLKPAGVICEILKEDGTMARRDDLIDFARLHNLKIVTVADIIEYRLRNETMVQRIAEAEAADRIRRVHRDRVPHAGRFHRASGAGNGQYRSVPPDIRARASRVFAGRCFWIVAAQHAQVASRRDGKNRGCGRGRAALCQARGEHHRGRTRHAQRARGRGNRPPG